MLEETDKAINELTDSFIFNLRMPTAGNRKKEWLRETFLDIIDLKIEKALFLKELGVRQTDPLLSWNLIGGESDDDK